MPNHLHASVFVQWIGTQVAFGIFILLLADATGNGNLQWVILPRTTGAKNMELQYHCRLCILMVSNHQPYVLFNQRLEAKGRFNTMSM